MARHEDKNSKSLSRVTDMLANTVEHSYDAPYMISNAIHLGHGCGFHAHTTPSQRGLGCTDMLIAAVLCYTWARWCQLKGKGDLFLCQLLSCRIYSLTSKGQSVQMEPTWIIEVSHCYARTFRCDIANQSGKHTKTFIHAHYNVLSIQIRSWLVLSRGLHVCMCAYLLHEHVVHSMLPQ